MCAEYIITSSLLVISKLDVTTCCSRYDSRIAQLISTDLACLPSLCHSSLPLHLSLPFFLLDHFSFSYPPSLPSPPHLPCFLSVPISSSYLLTFLPLPSSHIYSHSFLISISIPSCYRYSHSFLTLSVPIFSYSPASPLPGWHRAYVGGWTEQNGWTMALEHWEEKRGW